MNDQRHVNSSLSPLVFAGSYEDAIGVEEISWLVKSSTRHSPPGQPGFEFWTTIRGVAFWGDDLDGLAAEDPALAASRGFPEGDLPACVLSGDLPCVVEQRGARAAGTIRFRLELPPRDPARPDNLRLSFVIAGQRYEVVDEWFEDGVLRLAKLLPPGVRLICCVTCLFSDYSPGGHGLLGMLCHRNAKQQYLAVRSKAEYWHVPATEEVMETHHCDEFQHRVPGTGYRG
jgi:Family of unknown function (DUF6304)